MNEVVNTFCSLNLPRIEKLVGTDEAVYALACHAFLEGLATVVDAASKDCGFEAKLDAIQMALRSPRIDPHASKRPRNNLSAGRNRINRVRHEFSAFEKEDALAITADFVRFLEALGIGHEVLTKLSGELQSYWKAKRSPIEYHQALRAAVLKANQLKSEAQLYGAKLAQYAAIEEEVEKRRFEQARLEAELAQVRDSSDAAKKKTAEQRARLSEVNQRVHALEQELKATAEVTAYAEYLSRFTSYTRSRSDYERSVLKLSAEQQQAVDAIKATGDYLIRGPAGTGKTLVVMHAVQKERERAASELGLADSAMVAVLTYTKTLARFNRYLAHILKSDTPDTVIKNVDSFYQGEVTKLGYRIVYDRTERERIGRHSLPFLSLDQLVVEVGEFILGNDLTREEYVDQVVPRRGLRQPLSRKQREEVWLVVEAVVAEMESSKIVSKYYAVALLKRAVESDPELRARLTVRRVFVDEAQDLAAVEIQFLRLISANGLVVVGDEQQMIYRLGGSYLRAGIDIRGARTKVLKVNYRNTEQVCRLSEIYRTLDGSSDAESFGLGEAFRIGPVPELFRCQGSDQLWHELLGRLTFFVSHLKYEPESLAVLAPTNNELNRVERALQQAGYQSCKIMADDFDFEQSRGVRLSTLHSAKGLEFSVVFLVLQNLRQSDDLSQSLITKQYRNLIYVSLTRAMDNLQVFTLAEPPEFAIQDLHRAFEQMDAEFKA